MSIMISALSSDRRAFTDAESAAIDAASISLSEGNWREHLTEYFNGEVSDEICINDLSREVDAFLFFYDSKTDIKESVQWHIQVAGKLRDLIAVGQASGCDRIGIVG